ncbi:hypothetical protein KX252_15415, partial [Escherichia coli]
RESFLSRWLGDVYKQQEYIRWSASEISTDGLEMTVALRETSVGKGVPGKFRALATFNFSYQ